jgi:hypothetical protein
MPGRLLPAHEIAHGPRRLAKSAGLGDNGGRQAMRYRVPASLGVVVSLVALTACASTDMPPAPPRPLTFEQRCADPAVVKCIGFDTAADVDPFVYPPYGLTEKRAGVVMDVKASGAGYRRDSTIRLWVAEEGRPSRLAVDQTGYDLANTNPASRYGKLWLLPYHTNKDPGQRHPTAYTWYDELVISRARIADPAATLP